MAGCVRKPISCAVLAAVLVVTFQGTALAAPGDLDSTFSGDGKVTTNFTSRLDEALAIAIQPDGKILGGGESRDRFALARYTATGDLDTTLSADGKVLVDFGSRTDWINALAVQVDGKIVAAGGSYSGRSNVKVALARFNDDGSLDTSFSGDGKVTTNFTRGYDYAEDVVLQPDGKIVVAGGAEGRFALARYTTTGVPDTTFDGDGKVTTDFMSGGDDAVAVAIQPDGRIVAAGWAGPRRSSDYRFAVARYETGGALDTTFGGGDGKATTNFTPGNDYAWDMALQADGKIVLVGAAAGQGERFALMRYNPDGTVDGTFGGGRVITNFNTGSDVATGVAVQSDGKIIAAGWSGPRRGRNYSFAVARYEIGGGLDTTFGGGDGKATTNFTPGLDYAWDMALQADGRVVAIGAVDGGDQFALARYEV